MLEKTKTEFLLELSDGHTTTRHDRENMAGPKEICYDGELLISGFSTYLDDRKDSMAVVRTSKGFRKGGVDNVDMAGYLPIGNETYFRHKYQYCQDHARISTDVKITRGTVIKRHFSVGSFKLHGKWKRYFLLPAAQHITEGAKADWHAIDYGKIEEKPLMIGHWHRPPVSLVFERQDGLLVEVGTGPDIWRWEHSLGYGPEAGSYKLFLTEDSIEVQREPLMCCEDFEPEPREYRFTWNLSWRKPKGQPKVQQWLNPFGGALPKEDAEHIGIDFGQPDLPESFYKTTSPEKWVAGEKSDCVCFAHHKSQAQLRKYIRRLKDFKNVKSITFKNISAGICVNPSHVDRKDKNAYYHNDSNYIIDFIDWAKNAMSGDMFEPRECEIIIEKSNDFPTFLDYKI